jgi:pimeloyl-ACP methyl ester carboxylesterase
MTLLLVHGGGFSSSCWDRVVPHLRSPSIAVDLPGRGTRPADLATVSIADFAAAVVAEIESGDLSNVVLVGHSLAGMTLPRVVGMVPERLSGVVFVSCCVPPHGRSTLEYLGRDDVRDLAETAGAAEPAPPGVLDADVATAIFCNDMDDETTAFTLSIMCPEAGGVVNEPIDLSGLSAPIPRAWVRLTNDVIVTPAQQDCSIAELGDTEVVDLDAGHMAMISRPRELAAILDRIHDAYATRP